MSEPHESDTSSVTDTAAQPSEDVRPADVAAIEMSLDVHEAPPEVAEPEQPSAAPAAHAGTPWWPFLMYLGVWIGSMGATGWLFTGLPSGITLYGSDPYAYMVLGGVGLTLVGPALTLGVWLVLCVRAGRGRRTGLFSSSLVRGALVTLAGVAVWWGMLIAVDALRLGRPW